MAVTVVSNLTVIDNADSIGACLIWTGCPRAPTICTGAATIEGAGHLIVRACAGINFLNNVPVGCNPSLKNRHWYAWIRESDPQDLQANSGLRLGISSNAIAAGCPGNVGTWLVSGSDFGVATLKGWKRVVIDPIRPFDFTVGTPPAVTCINQFHYRFNVLSGGRCSSYIDQHVHASTITVTAGTDAVPGDLQTLQDNDATNVRGFFQKVNGVFFASIALIMGDTGTAANFFRDTNQSIVWSEWNVSATLYKISVVGNATSSCNKIRFGTFSGTGVDREGGNGIVITSAGLAPFRIEAIDSNVNEFGLYGSTITNPTIIRCDRLETYTVEDNSLSTFTEDTRDANDAGASDAPVFPATDAVNDSANFGHNERFSELQINTGTAGVGTYTVTWEYSTASGFSALTDVTDGTGDFKTTGLQTVSYSIPDDWVTRSVGGDTRYWIRARRDAGTSTTNPSLTQVTTSMGGGVRLEHTNAEAIRDTFTNMDTIRIRSSAKFKKNIVSSSVAPAKSSAIDLGAVNPAADTFRDINIQNCEKGILLQKTAAGNVSYSFRNIKFSGNNLVDQAWQLNQPSTFTDETADSNSITANDIQFFPVVPVANDAFYLGDNAPFNEFTVNVGTAGVGTYTVTWQYWNGSAWTAVSGLTDGTNAFKNVGTNTVVFTRPTNWARRTDGGVNKFYLRALRDGGTETTRPLGTQVEIPGDVRVDFPTASTVTIEILEGGDTPQIDNVNGSTIVINNTVNISIHCERKDTGANIQNARVLVTRISDGVDITTGLTDVNGDFADTFNFASDVAVTIEARKSTLPVPRFFTEFQSGTISASGLNTTFLMREDTIVSQA